MAQPNNIDYAALPNLDQPHLIAIFQSLNGRLVALENAVHNAQGDIANQDIIIASHTTIIQNLQGQLAALQQIHINLPANFAQQVAAIPQQPRESKLPTPESYAGERTGNKARTFIQACELYQAMRPSEFPTNRMKIQWTILLLKDLAGSWAAPIVTDLASTANPPPARANDWATFRQEFETAFFDPDEKRNAAYAPRSLKQTKSAGDYAAEFRRLTTLAGFTEEVQLMESYRQGLKDAVKDALSNQLTEPRTLEELLQMTIKLDNHIHQNNVEKRQHTSSSSSSRPAPRPAPAPVYVSRPTFVPSSAVPVVPVTSAPVDPNAMDLSAGTKRLSEAERMDQMRRGLCLYCDQAGHKRSDHVRNG